MTYPSDYEVASRQTLEHLTSVDRQGRLTRVGHRVVTMCMDPRLILEGAYRRHPGGGIGLTVVRNLTGKAYRLDTGMQLLTADGLIAGGHRKGCTFDQYLPAIVGNIASKDEQTLALATKLIALAREQGPDGREWLDGAEHKIEQVAERAKRLEELLDEDHEPGRLIDYMDESNRGIDNVLTPTVEARPVGYVIDLSRAPNRGFDGSGLEPIEVPQMYLDETRHTLENVFVDPQVVAANALVSAATRVAVDGLKPGLPTFVILGSEEVRYAQPLEIS